MIVVYLESLVFLSVELSLCWPQCVRAGDRLSLAGHSRLLDTGSDTS